MSENTIYTRRRFAKAGLVLATTLQLQRAAQALGIGADAKVCSLAAEQEAGPYYIADELLRSEITEQKPGVPLSLRIVLLDARTCKPLPDAAVDIWHCDALGLYSGFTKQNPMRPGGPRGFGGPGGRGGPGGPGGPPPGFDPEHPENRLGPPEGMGGPPRNHPSDKLTFLRGIQLSDVNGAVQFQTIFPGVYMGRTNHIHFKVRLGGKLAEKSYAAGHTSHIGQIFFPEEFTAKLMAQEPYNKHQIHRTTQAEDSIFTGQHGDASMARITLSQPKDILAPLTAELIATVDPTATPSPVRQGPGPRRPPFGGPAA